jgi:CubicO group peptidase (beta-lactamase class C family)
MGDTDVREVLARHVAAGALPGAVALVAVGEEARIDAAGTVAFDDPTPMAADTVMRIASLTKPVTAATAMSLVEEGRISLDDPVERHLVELADRRVLRAPDAALDDTVPAERPVTVYDLLTFRAGFGIVLAEPGSTPIQRAEAALGLMTMGPPWPRPPYGTDEWMARFASLPLVFQPGTHWQYNTAATLLGVLVERAAGAPLETVMRERVFEPLAMRDTAFSIPARALAEGRVATAYQPDPDGVAHLFDRPEGMWAQPPRMPDGAAWLVSTMADFWAFVRMLLRGGRAPDDTRVLSSESVAAMTRDHLTDEQRRRDAAPFLGGAGWGFAMAAPPADGGPCTTPGFGWDGGSGTTWRTDPATGLSGILFTQRQMTSPEPPRLFLDFWEAARAGLPARG